MSSSRHDVVVIGAGVFGAWIAWFLASSGRRVLLVDQYGAANTRASSGGESRVIRMAYGADAIYTGMAKRSLVLWQQLFEQVGRPELFQPTGVLWMARHGNAAATDSLAALRAHAVEHAVLEADQMRQTYPQIEVPDDGWAIFEPGSGGLLARRAVQAVVGAAQALGVDMLIDRVLPLATEATPDRVLTAAGRSLQAEQFVYACGPWLKQVWPQLLGRRIFISRQEVFYFGTQAGDPRFAPPQMPTWMDFDRDWYGLPDIEGRGFKLACDRHGPAIDPDQAERLVSAEGIAAARAFLARRFPALCDAPLLASEVCQYENTHNGDFLIDRHPQFENVWLAGGGSGHGFKHGPAVAEYLLQRWTGQIPAEARFSLECKLEQQQRQVH